MITALMFFGLLIYLISISSRITKIEKALNLKPTTPTSALYSPKPVPSSAALRKPSATPAAPASALYSQQSNPQVFTGFDSKSFINALPKIGVLALIFGLAFFLKYAIDQGWVSVSLRLGLGGVIGTLLLMLYYLWKEKYTRYAMALAGGGLAIWYLTVFAAVQMYNVLSIEGGLVLLSGIAIVSLLLAYYSKSASLSALAWGGAFLSPLLLSVSAQSYTLMLVYVTIVTLGLLISIFYTKSYKLFTLVIVGVGLNLIIGSMSNSYFVDYHFNTLIFLIVQLIANSYAIAAIIMKAKASGEVIKDTEFALLLIVIFMVLGGPLVYISYFHFNEFAPLIISALAVYLFLVYTSIDRLEVKAVNYILSGIGTLAICLAIFWHFGDTPQTFMFYRLGLVGIIVGSIQKRIEIRAWGLVTIMLGIFSACMISYDATQTLLLTQKFGMEMLGLVALAISYMFFKEDALHETEKDIHQALLYIISTFLWLFVSWDLIHFYNQYDQLNQRNLSLSIWGIIYATALLIAASVPVLKPLRKMGLLLFGLVIVKVFLYDVQSLDTLYRIISFISLGTILLIVSFIYQHNKEKIKKYLET